MVIGLSALALALFASQTFVQSERARRPARALGSVVAASGAYFTSYLLLVLAGLVSMPIMTRLLSKADYGLLSLVFAAVSVLAVVGGLGFGEAAVRLYGEGRADGAVALRRLCDSLLGGALGMGLLVGLAVAFVARAFTGATSPEYGRCLLLASVLIVVRVVSGVLYQIYRAQERAVAHGATQVSVRYATTVLAIALLLLYERNAFIVILATLFVEAAAVGVRFFDLSRRGIITRPRLEPRLVAAAASYGVPLAVAGAARFLLDYGDRFVIERLLDLSAVATYSVAYDVAQKLAEGLLGPVQLAVVPIFFRLWADEGGEETARFASRVLTYMVAFTVPVALLYWALSDEVIILLASSKYRGSSALTPYLLPGVILGSMNFIAIVGLTIQKRTVILAVNVCLAAIFNVALNLLLVPRYGLAGAAVATTLAYAALLSANYALSRSVLRLRLDGVIVGRTLVASAAMLLLVSRAGLAEWPLLFSVAVRGALGAGTIALCFSLLDADLRRWAWARVHKTARGRQE